MQPRLDVILKSFINSPILFIGSGISRRYFNTDDWNGLLKYMTGLISDDELAYLSYHNKAGQGLPASEILPKVAELIEHDFNDKWYNDRVFRKQHNAYLDKAESTPFSPFKAEVCEYIKSKGIFSDTYAEEIRLLKAIGTKSISGVVTTNYDSLLEAVFEDYVIYIGQEELLLSNTQGVGEIYKIHGCCSKPESLVINTRDYQLFKDKKQYLAAKLLTLFIEYPIIFLGYSISDSNIIEILESIVQCFTQEQLGKLKNKFIFVEWNRNPYGDSMEEYSQRFESGKSIPFTKLYINDFGILYKALLARHSKYETRILRKLKNELYNIVVNNPTKAEIYVRDVDAKDLDKAEYVIGVGVISQLGKKGYATFSANEIYQDIVLGDLKHVDYNAIVQNTIPSLLSMNSGKMPFFKYMKGMDRNCIPQKILILLNKIEKDGLSSFFSERENTQRIKQKVKYKNISEVVGAYTGIKKQISEIILMKEKALTANDLRLFLLNIYSNHPSTLKEPVYGSYIKKLIRIYDWLEYK